MVSNLHISTSIGFSSGSPISKVCLRMLWFYQVHRSSQRSQWTQKWPHTFCLIILSLFKFFCRRRNSDSTWLPSLVVILAMLANSREFWSSGCQHGSFLLFSGLPLPSPTPLPFWNDSKSFCTSIGWPGEENKYAIPSYKGSIPTIHLPLPFFIFIFTSTPQLHLH